MTKPTGSSGMNAQRYQALIDYWTKDRHGLVENLRDVRERELDRQRVLANNSCFMVGHTLIGDFMQLTIVDEDELARQVLDTAEFYFRTAIERDDIGAHRMVEQYELGRAEQVRLLTVVRWLKERRLDLEEYRRAIEMKRKWNESLFSMEDWTDTDFDLGDWMGEYLILGEFEEARRIYASYSRGGLGYRRRGRRYEDTLHLVAECLAQPEHQKKCHEAEAALDKLYGSVTNWGAPGFRLADMLYEERFMFAYVRGKYFKGEDDPIRVIKKMKFRE